MAHTLCLLLLLLLHELAIALVGDAAEAQHRGTPCWLVLLQDYLQQGPLALIELVLVPATGSGGQADPQGMDGQSPSSGGEGCFGEGVVMWWGVWRGKEGGFWRAITGG